MWGWGVAERKDVKMRPVNEMRWWYGRGGGGGVDYWAKGRGGGDSKLMLLTC